MNLYRVDTPLGAVSDLGGPCLYRRWTAARAAALATLNRPATITRITGGGACKIVAQVDASGRVRRA